MTAAEINAIAEAVADILIPKLRNGLACAADPIVKEEKSPSDRAVRVGKGKPNGSEIREVGSLSGKVLNSKEAAEFLGTTTNTLGNWRCHGKGPKHVKLGRCVRYRKSDLETYINELQ